MEGNAASSSDVAAHATRDGVASDTSFEGKGDSLIVGAHQTTAVRRTGDMLRDALLRIQGRLASVAL